MRRKRRSFALRLLWWFFCAAFVVSAGLIAVYLLQSASHQRELGEMAAFVQGANSATPIAAETPPPTERPALTSAPTQAAALTPTQAAQPTATPLSAQDEALMSRLRALAKQNPDFIGWLRVDGTNINEPVMHTPNDSQYYLHRDFEGAYFTAAQLFLDGSCDAGDVPGNKIIYGHNMRDGTRFADLKRYLNEDFLRAHPDIQFDTLSGRGQYEVLAAFTLQIGEPDAPVMLCYRRIDTTDEAAVETLRRYLAQYAQARAEGVTPQRGDELLTLSTCGREGSNERVIVMARRVRE